MSRLTRTRSTDEHPKRCYVRPTLAARGRLQALTAGQDATGNNNDGVDEVEE